jgi:hypothetical protein
MPYLTREQLLSSKDVIPRKSQVENAQSLRVKGLNTFILSSVLEFFFKFYNYFLYILIINLKNLICVREAHRRRSCGWLCRAG